jgi:hypothetical protein
VPRALIPQDNPLVLDVYDLVGIRDVEEVNPGWLSESSAGKEEGDPWLGGCGRRLNVNWGVVYLLKSRNETVH